MPCLLSGWSICANCMGIEQLPVKAGSPTKAAPGMDVQVLGEDGRPVKRGEIGALVVKLPGVCDPLIHQHEARPVLLEQLA